MGCFDSMSYLVLINAKAGTVRDCGAAALKSDIESAFSAQGARAEIRMLHPRRLNKEIRQAIDDSADERAIIVGGGDGTLSAAAAMLAQSDKPLGVLPLGTMNLFARAIGIPLEPSEAIETLIGAVPAKIDLLEIGRQKVLMHASIGLQPKIIRMREAMPYKTRFARMLNGIIAWIRVTRRLQRIRIRWQSQENSVERIASAILISNNILPEEAGEVPVSHNLDGGEVAIYVTASNKRHELVQLALATSLGAWRASDLVEEFRLQSAEIGSSKKSLLVSVDGEVVRFRTPFQVKVVPRSLTVLMPTENPV